MNSLKEIAQVLKRSSRILLCGHVSPDGDCVGSVAALGRTLEKMGKKAVLVSPDPIPENLLFLPGVDGFYIGHPPELQYDTMVVLDCAEEERLGLVSRYLEQTSHLICLDHHSNAKGFRGYNYFDSRAAATGEIVIDLMDEMGIGLDKETATYLYTAIVTDSGNFRYEKTTPDTLRRAARLMETGIDAPLINIKLFEEKPWPAVQVLGSVLQNMKSSPCGRVAWVVVEKAILKQYSAKDEHTEGLVNVARAIKGVEVAILFKEMEADKCKISFRSKGQVAVDQLAARYGGGGHTRASGCIVMGKLPEIVDLVVGQALLELTKVES